jgi:hypothetical protein
LPTIVFDSTINGTFYRMWSRRELEKRLAHYAADTREEIVVTLACLALVAAMMWYQHDRLRWPIAKFGFLWTLAGGISLAIICLRVVWAQRVRWGLVCHTCGGWVTGAAGRRALKTARCVHCGSLAIDDSPMTRRAAAPSTLLAITDVSVKVMPMIVAVGGWLHTTHLTPLSKLRVVRDAVVVGAAAKARYCPHHAPCFDQFERHLRLADGARAVAVRSVDFGQQEHAGLMELRADESVEAWVRSDGRILQIARNGHVLASYEDFMYRGSRADLLWVTVIGGMGFVLCLGTAFGCVRLAEDWRKPIPDRLTLVRAAARA